MEAETLGQGQICGLSTQCSPQQTVLIALDQALGSWTVHTLSKAFPVLEDSGTEKIDLAFQESEPISAYKGSCGSTY